MKNGRKGLKTEIMDERSDSKIFKFICVKFFGIFENSYQQYNRILDIWTKLNKQLLMLPTLDV